MEPMDRVADAIRGEFERLQAEVERLQARVKELEAAADTEAENYGLEMKALWARMEMDD